MVFRDCLLSLLDQLDMNIRNRPWSFVVIAKSCSDSQRSNSRSVFRLCATWITMRKTPLVWYLLALQNTSCHKCCAAWRPRTAQRKLRGGKDGQHVASLVKRNLQLKFPFIAPLSKKQNDHKRKWLNINKSTQIKIKCLFHAKYLPQTDKKQHITFFKQCLSVTNLKEAAWQPPGDCKKTEMCYN